jgi:hypothetical protein
MATMRTPSTACDVCWDTGVSPRRAACTSGHRSEGMKVRTTSMMRPISASKPGAVHGALVLAGDLVELEGGSVIDPSTDLVRNLELLIGTGRT